MLKSIIIAIAIALTLSGSSAFAQSLASETTLKSVFDVLQKLPTRTIRTITFQKDQRVKDGQGIFYYPSDGGSPGIGSSGQERDFYKTGKCPGDELVNLVVSHPGWDPQAFQTACKILADLLCVDILRNRLNIDEGLIQKTAVTYRVTPPGDDGLNALEELTCTWVEGVTPPPIQQADTNPPSTHNPR